MRYSTNCCTCDPATWMPALPSPFRILRACLSQPLLLLSRAVSETNDQEGSAEISLIQLQLLSLESKCHLGGSFLWSDMKQYLTDCSKEVIGFLLESINGVSGRRLLRSGWELL